MTLLDFSALYWIASELGRRSAPREGEQETHRLLDDIRRQDVERIIRDEAPIILPKPGITLFLGVIIRAVCTIPAWVLLILLLMLLWQLHWVAAVTAGLILMVEPGMEIVSFILGDAPAVWDAQKKRKNMHESRQI